MMLPGLFRARGIAVRRNSAETTVWPVATLQGQGLNQRLKMDEAVPKRLRCGTI